MPVSREFLLYGGVLLVMFCFLQSEVAESYVTRSLGLF